MCITDGILRAKLDGELAQAESLMVDSHLATCINCRRRAKAMAKRIERVYDLFSVLSPASSESSSETLLAFDRFKNERNQTKYNPFFRLFLNLTRGVFNSSIPVPIPVAAALIIFIPILFIAAFRSSQELKSTVQPALPNKSQIIETSSLQAKIPERSLTIENSVDRSDKVRNLNRGMAGNRFVRAKLVPAHTDLQLASIEFEQKLRRNEKSFLGRKIRYLNPDSSALLSSLNAQPIVWQRDRLTIDNSLWSKVKMADGVQPISFMNQCSENSFVRINRSIFR